MHAPFEKGYHNAIRRTRQIEKDIRKEKVAEHCQEKSAKKKNQKKKKKNQLFGSYTWGPPLRPSLVAVAGATTNAGIIQYVNNWRMRW